jgi:hypothetical protein
MVENSNVIISDQNLDDLVQHTISQHPFVGQSFVWGVLRSQGYCVTRERVREALRRCDPVGTASRWCHTITPRRPYSVPGPNSLWHIDGNHKLIRWRIVCHGGIDGFSRMIVYLKCSNNNRSQTVFDLFAHAVERFGLPSRVRSDYGSENYLVARHMILRRGVHRGSMLTGSSTHNQRIERLWVDMYRSVTVVYYRLFYHLEDQQLLDPLNEVHLFALQYIYIPRINYSLECFQEGWNQHGIRTAQHLSPKQLFIRGVLRLHSSGHVALDFLDRVDETYGLSYQDPTPGEHGSVNVPESRFSIQTNDFQQLQSLINPLQECDDYGIQLYLSTLQFLRTAGYT